MHLDKYKPTEIINLECKKVFTYIFYMDDYMVTYISIKLFKGKQTFAKDHNKTTTKTL